MSRGSKQTSRKDILRATRKLFTESEFNNVSLRDIAQELGISVGNLTYYYKSKLSLIEAAVMDKHSNTIKSTPARTLEEVSLLLKQTQQMHEEHLYYFRHYSQLTQMSKSIQQMQSEIYKESNALWNDTFANLFNAGLIQTEHHNGQFECLISTILFLSAHWHERDAVDEAIGIKAPSFYECA